MGWNERCSFDVLKGRTLRSIDGAVEGSDRIVFETTDGERFLMYHYQDCCECVSIHTVSGDVTDLIGYPLLEAEEVSGETPDVGADGVNHMNYDSYTWTFYKLGTSKGHVTLAWLGTSNGYYSERVDFERLT